MVLLDPKEKLQHGHASMDVAFVDSDTLTAPLPFQAHILDLDGIYITFTDFINLFFSYDGIHFQMNYAQVFHPCLTFYNRTMDGQPFHLMNSILYHYERDLGKFNSDCIEPCSLIDIYTKLLSYKSIVHCKSIKTSLTSDDIIQSIFHHAEKQNMEKCISSYHLLHVNIRFFNHHPSIQDIIVRFNYIVYFNDKQLIERVVQSNFASYEYDTSQFDFHGFIPNIEFLNERLDGALTNVMEYYITPYANNDLIGVNSSLKDYVETMTILQNLQCKTDIVDILINTIRAIFDYIHEKKNNIRLLSKINTLETQLQECIDGINQVKTFCGGNRGNVGLSFSFRLVPLMNEYILLFGIPSSNNPVDPFKLYALKEHFISQGLDPYKWPKTCEN